MQGYVRGMCGVCADPTPRDQGAILGASGIRRGMCRGMCEVCAGYVRIRHHSISHSSLVQFRFRRSAHNYTQHTRLTRHARVLGMQGSPDIITCSRSEGISFQLPDTTVLGTAGQAAGGLCSGEDAGAVEREGYVQGSMSRASGGYVQGRVCAGPAGGMCREGMCESMCGGVCAGYVRHRRRLHHSDPPKNREHKRNEHKNRERLVSVSCRLV